MLSSGLNLMLLGMGTVFLFLTLLVIATMTMSALVKKYQLPPEGADTTGAGPEQDPVLLAVISAAVHAHRSKGR